MPNRPHLVIDSQLGTLRLTDAEYKSFMKDCEAIFKKYYNLERGASGIYASNQDKYVSTRDELTPWDDHSMEDRYVD